MYCLSHREGNKDIYKVFCVVFNNDNYNRGGLLSFVLCPHPSHSGVPLSNI